MKPPAAAARHRSLLHRLRRACAARLRRVRDRLLSTRLVRRWSGQRLAPFHVRVLTPTDADALDAFCRAYIPHLRQHVVRQCRSRWPGAGFGVAAVDRAGRVVGFAFVDEYAREGADLPGWWARALKVRPDLRRLGLGAGILELLFTEAHERGLRPLYADIHEDNHISLGMVLRFPFVPAPASLIDAVNLSFPDGRRRPRTVLEYRPAPADAYDGVAAATVGRIVPTAG